jgi:hypothetical protein
MNLTEITFRSVTAPLPEGMGSSCERILSNAENVTCGVAIPIVFGSTIIARPHSLIQVCAAFRPSNAVAF